MHDPAKHAPVVGPRFKLLRQLGAGSMGVVYEARDRQSGGRVAVKTLHGLDAEALFRLKNEFRALRDLDHPNLARLHELVEEDGHWFLVMEFIDGVDVLAHHRGGRNVVAAAATARVSLRALAAEHEPRSVPEPTAKLDYGEVRRVLAELALGLDVMARAGCVHRDIKPSNVMVGRDGRVVILDFGLATDQRATTTSLDGGLVGTVPYMAPEQALGHRVGPEADCYALGVLLFEVLTGRWPVDGAVSEILVAKQTQVPPAPATLVADVPSDLDALCVELLQIDPARRPTAAEVIVRLAPTRARAVSLPGLAGSSSRAHFVGRQHERRVLDDALCASRDGEAQVVWLTGPSGIGKSTLLRNFVEHVRANRPDAVVLASRCYAREVLPFKAVDGVIDALSAFLRGIDATESAALVPRHGAALTELFPVLARVPAIAEAPATRRAIRDPQERRARAFGALRELLGRLAERHPVVVMIDDLQWSDSDSGQLLQDLLRPPEAPDLLLVMASRDEPAATALAELLASSGRVPQRLVVGALDGAASADLAHGLLEERGVTGVAAAAVAAEAGGNPLYIHELVRHASLHGAVRPVELHLDDAIWQRVLDLPDAARDVLDLVVLAGTRITLQVLTAACGLPLGALGDLLGRLAAHDLVRTTGRRGPDLVEPYHDRISETVLAHLAELSAHEGHRRLAFALEGAPDVTARPELLMVHFRASGHLDKAARYAARAARAAADQLAFGRSADLFREALALAAHDDAEAQTIRVLVAEALTRAGRLREAAEAFEEAATRATDRKAVFALRCCALEQLLRGGQLERGLGVGRVVLDGIGVRVPRGPRRAIAGMLVRRAWLTVRGRGIRERPADQLPIEEQTAVDVLWSVASGIGLADPIVGRAVQVQYVTRAFASGDVRRIALAITSEIGYAALGGTRVRGKVERLCAEAQQVAERAGDPHALGMASACAGLGRFLCGDFAEAVTRFDVGLAILRERTLGTRWEIDVGELFRLGALVYLGRLDQATRDVSRLQSEALQHGDEYLAIGTRAWRAGLVWLVQGRVGELRRNIEAARSITNPEARRFTLPDAHYLVAVAQADLYEDRPDDAWRRVTQAAPALDASFLLRIQTVAIDAAFLRLRVQLAMAVRSTGTVRTQRLHDASTQARRLERVGAPWSDALAGFGRAMLALATGERAEAGRGLLAAADRLDARELRLHAVAARLRAADLGAGEPAAIRARAAAYFAQHGVVDPVALCRVLVPI